MKKDISQIKLLDFKPRHLPQDMLMLVLFY